jgi:hypothetical protein
MKKKLKNTKKYSYNWQPYNGYDKFEYDLVLKSGTIVENCFAETKGVFTSYSDYHEDMEFNEDEIAEIRFSANPKLDINQILTAKDVGIKPKPVISAKKYTVVNDEVKKLVFKIQRNDPCSCGSGKKYKNCCLKS